MTIRKMIHTIVDEVADVLTPAEPDPYSTVFSSPFGESTSVSVLPVSNLTETADTTTSVTLSWTAPPLPDYLAVRYNLPSLKCSAMITQSTVTPASVLAELAQLQAILASAQTLATQISTNVGKF